ncbi:hypothetical protein [Streptomyces sp. NPDC015125]|uniref:hypothetical protein n=1 Tax=Streptomyces sp. NPDC015125 TaxID=3364938 RepID=UPI0036F83C1C
MDARVLLVAARLQRIEYRALLAMAVGEVGEVGGGGGDTVIDLQKHSLQGGAVRGSERAFAFSGPRHLRLVRNIAKRS